MHPETAWRIVGIHPSTSMEFRIEMPPVLC